MVDAVVHLMLEITVTGLLNDHLMATLHLGGLLKYFSWLVKRVVLCALHVSLDE